MQHEGRTPGEACHHISSYGAALSHLQHRQLIHCGYVCHIPDRLSLGHGQYYMVCTFISNIGLVACVGTQGTAGTFQDCQMDGKPHCLCVCLTGV